MKLIILICCVINISTSLWAFELKSLSHLKSKIQNSNKDVIKSKRESSSAPYMFSQPSHGQPQPPSLHQQLPLQQQFKSYLPSEGITEGYPNYNQFSFDAYGKGGVSSDALIAALNSEQSGHNRNVGNDFRESHARNNIETYIVASGIADGFGSVNNLLSSTNPMEEYKTGHHNGYSVQNLKLPSESYDSAKFSDTLAKHNARYAFGGDISVDRYPYISQDLSQAQTAGKFNEVHYDDGIGNLNFGFGQSPVIESGIKQHGLNPFEQLSYIRPGLNFGYKFVPDSHTTLPSTTKFPANFGNIKFLYMSGKPFTLENGIINTADNYPGAFDFSMSSNGLSNYNVPQYAVGHKGLRHYQSQKPFAFILRNPSNLKSIFSQSNTISSEAKSSAPFKPSAFLGATLESFQPSQEYTTAANTEHIKPIYEKFSQLPSQDHDLSFLQMHSMPQSTFKSQKEDSLFPLQSSFNQNYLHSLSSTSNHPSAYNTLKFSANGPPNLNTPGYRS